VSLPTRWVTLAPSSRWLVEIELVKFARYIRRSKLIIMAVIAGVSLVTNMAIGFVGAVTLYHAFRKWRPAYKYLG